MSLNKLSSLWKVGLGGTIGFVGLNLYNHEERFYHHVYSMAMPFFHQFVDPELSHRLAIICAKHRIGTRLASSQIKYDNLENDVWNLHFDSPIGLAAGFDKNGEAVVGLADIGFSFVEIGSITPQPQLGNDKPRVFRLLEDKSIINRYGFNSLGLTEVKHNLSKARSHLPFYVIGVNLGKNKTSDDAIKDYTDGLAAFCHLGSYFVINISSPNTPGLRQLQNKEELDQLLSSINLFRKNNKELLKRPLLIKIAPDLTSEQESKIAQLMLKHKVDGLVVSNTTTRREMLQNEKLAKESGGLSGLALRDISTSLIGRMYKLTNGKIPIIGVGGVFTGGDAYDKIKAGASLVQVYSALAFEGPPLINRMKKELSDLVAKDGYGNIREAIGVDKNKF